MTPVFLAEHQVSTTDPIGIVLQYGLLGVILILLLTGGLWTKPAVEDLKKSREEDRKMWEERLLPTMTRVAEALETNNRRLSEVIRLLGGK